MDYAKLIAEAIDEMGLYELDQKLKIQGYHITPTLPKLDTLKDWREAQETVNWSE